MCLLRITRWIWTQHSEVLKLWEMTQAPRVFPLSLFNRKGDSWHAILTSNNAKLDWTWNLMSPRTDWQASASGGRNSVLWNVLCLSRRHKLLPQVIALLNMPPDCTWRTERTTSGWWGSTSSDWRGCGKHWKKGAANDNPLSLKVLPAVLISPHHINTCWMHAEYAGYSTNTTPQGTVNTSGTVKTFHNHNMLNTLHIHPPSTLQALHHLIQVAAASSEHGRRRRCLPGPLARAATSLACCRN